MKDNVDIITILGERFWLEGGERHMYYMYGGACLNGTLFWDAARTEHRISAKLGTEERNTLIRSGLEINYQPLPRRPTVTVTQYLDDRDYRTRISVPDNNPVVGKIPPRWSEIIILMLKSTIPYLMSGPLDNPSLLEKVCAAITAREGSSEWTSSLHETTRGMNPA